MAYCNWCKERDARGEWIGTSRKEKNYKGQIVWRGAEFVCYDCLSESQSIVDSEARERKNKKKTPYQRFKEEAPYDSFYPYTQL